MSIGYRKKKNSHGSELPNGERHVSGKRLLQHIIPQKVSATSLGTLIEDALSYPSTMHTREDGERVMVLLNWSPWRFAAVHCTTVTGYKVKGGLEQLTKVASSNGLFIKAKGAKKLGVACSCKWKIEMVWDPSSLL
ncbi:hypothetical protein AgCh_040396 [Apium graveolens]